MCSKCRIIQIRIKTDVQKENNLQTKYVPIYAINEKVIILFLRPSALRIITIINIIKTKV